MPPRRRAPRAGQVNSASEQRRSAYEAHKASWESQKNRRAERLAKEKWYVDGRRLIKFLTALSGITGDDRFNAFAALMKEYGLTDGSPKKQSAALVAKLRPLFTDWNMALEGMAAVERDALAREETFSASDCAVSIADEYGLPGPSFETTVERLRKAFGRLDHTWRPHLKLGERTQGKSQALGAPRAQMPSRTPANGRGK
jgi:hypothetical protein